MLSHFHYFSLVMVFISLLLSQCILFRTEFIVMRSIVLKDLTCAYFHIREEPRRIELRLDTKNGIECSYFLAIEAHLEVNSKCFKKIKSSLINVDDKKVIWTQCVANFMHEVMFLSTCIIES